MKQKESIADHMQGALGVEVKDTAQTGSKEDDLAKELGVKVSPSFTSCLPLSHFCVS